MADNPFEIPQSMRDAVEQNLKQAHAAYEQLMDSVTKAMSTWTGAMPSNPMAAGFQDVQRRVTEFAKENADSAFTFAGKISKAQTPQDILTLQTEFVQDRMKSFITQTQQLYSVIGEPFQKSERGAIPMSAMPSNLTSSLITAGFKDVQDRAVAVAKQNADSDFALVEKMAKVQNFQEIFTLQTRFAQGQMQAFAAQTQELQKLIGETLQKLQRGSPS